MNAPHRTPAIFFNETSPHAATWNSWLTLCRDEGYDPVAPGWSGEPTSVSAAGEHRERKADQGSVDIRAQYKSIIESFRDEPLMIGNPIGGPVAERLLDKGASGPTIAPHPAQIKGVVPLPLAQLRDDLLPKVTTQASFRQYRDSTVMPELRHFEGCGHSLTTARGWLGVATACLVWLRERGLK